jgi:galactokinase
MENRKGLLEQTAELFRKRFSKEPELAVAAPGRVNIIGEHTDYNDGHVLPIAIDLYITAAASNRTDSKFRLVANDYGESFEFEPERLPDKWPLWAGYLVGVIMELQRDGYTIGGKDIIIHGNIPIGSGLSSSAALEVSTATAIERLEGLEIPDSRLVCICRRADHNFVGIKSGPMDQFASRACRAGHAGLLDCRSLVMTDKKLPEGVDFLSVYSGIPRALAASEYNERQSSCQTAAETLGKTHPQVKALRDAAPAMLEAHREALGDRVFRRARHVVGEQQRVFDLIDAFAGDDLPRAGEILLDGHRSLSEDYEVSLPILDEMIDWLYSREGVVGARLTGAGFGGSLVCLVRRGKIDVKKLSTEFNHKFGSGTPDPPQIWHLASVDGAKYQKDV